MRARRVEAEVAAVRLVQAEELADLVALALAGRQILGRLPRDALARGRASVFLFESP